MGNGNFSSSGNSGRNKGILIAVIVGGGAAIILLGPFFDEDFPINVYKIADKIKVDDNTTFNEILIQYQALVDQLFDPNFENLSEAEQQSIVNQLQALELELKRLSGDVNFVVDPNQPLPNVPTIPNVPLEDDPNMFEPPLECAVGFTLDEEQGFCFPDTFDDIFPDDPTDEVKFVISSVVTLEDSNGNRVEDSGIFNVPLSLLGLGGEILDLGKVEIDLTGLTEEDLIESYTLSGNLEVILNGNVLEVKTISGSGLPVDRVLNPLIDGSDIFIKNFDSLTGITTGINTLSFNVTNFEAKTGVGADESVFISINDIEIYSVDFDNNLARNTVTDSSGEVVTVPIADGTIKICSESVGIKISGVEYIYIPDVPSFVSVEIGTTNVIPAFSNPAPLPVIGSGTYVVPTSCTTKSGIPRDTTISISVGCCNYGTGSENKASSTKIFVVTTPKSAKNFQIDNFVSGRDDLRHYWISDFGLSYTRNTPS
jgi:hypothetical protein